MDAPERITKVNWKSHPEDMDEIGQCMEKVEYIRADLVPQWLPIETAPRDGSIILAVCKNDCSGPCGYSEQEPSENLCLYHAHAEGLQGTDDGPALVVWGGGWADSYEDGGGEMPDYWFAHGSDFEKVANPTHWMPLPEAPTT